MVERTIPIQKGEPAADFTLKDNRGKDFRLSEHKTKRVLLSFHPLAWTAVCAQQMQALEANVDAFNSLNAVPVGLSVDSVPSKNAWAKQLQIARVQLLSDFWPHGEVAKLYGVFREKDGFDARANIIIDENGKVVFTKVYEVGQLPDIQEIITALKEL